ncbi:unnamed protein product [Plutella xylostella]|uniref:(diamondback moth) hypothetical protein n=1 Tax=Plutella xylostella TaxID=51655 RepID=A0A8S4G7H0_PLUXY|nr:unnamed protein product [Plutella xylostella]
MCGTELPEHFYLGGATTLRGFRQRGAPRTPTTRIHYYPSKSMSAHFTQMYWASGVHMYWASGVHLYTPLPFRPGAGGLGDLFRSHLFANAGCLAGPEESSAMSLSSLSQVRVSIGAGIALRLGRVAKAELNYCVPIRACAGDATAPGLQLGVGAHFL